MIICMKIMNSFMYSYIFIVVGYFVVFEVVGWDEGGVVIVFIFIVL